MTGFFLDCLGRLFAAMPTALAEAFCKVIGDLIYFGLKKKRRALLSNLHHAFPDKPRQWHQKIARTSCRRTVELGLFALVSPAFSQKRLRRHFTLGEGLKKELAFALETKESGVILVPHFSLMEALTTLPAHFDEPIMPVGVLYRPLKQASLDRYVKRTRERFGIKLISRRDGFDAPMQMLREGGLVAVLFDQNAGTSGVLTTFFGRAASTTDLPGLIAQRFKTRVGVLYTERTGFWQGTIHLDILANKARATQVVLKGNQWLENRLKTSDDICADWLWLHSRWRCQDIPEKRLRLAAKRDAIVDTCEFHGWDALPRTTRFWVRMPNWLGDVVMALPLLRALRLSRPDAELTLLAQPHFLPLLEKLQVADRLLPLPKKGTSGYFKPFRAWAHQYPDVQLLFTNSTRGDLEAKCIGAPQRFGIARPGKPRRNLTHTWTLPDGLNEAELHQTRLWEQFFQHFGLRGELDLSPIPWPNANTRAKSAPRIGLIPGTENDPSKRWPVSHWHALIEQLLAEKPEAQLTTYGTARDVDITTLVVEGYPTDRVTDMAGKTGLVEFMDELSGLDLLICNDTGGMHLANAIGTPVLVIFGPTNPIRTGPIFDAPAVLLQPEGCPPTGGMPIDQVAPGRVAAEAVKLLG